MTGTDADIELKMRMQKILWALGYYTRIGVRIAAGQGQAKRSTGRSTVFELTDIDVLGIRVGADLSVEYIVADCTTRTSISPINRAFWLRGVMEYFSAGRGYILLTRDIPDYQKVIASRLGITLLDEQNLRRLEETYGGTGWPAHIGDPNAYKYLEGNISQLTKELRPLLDYREHEFWLNEPGRNVLRSISVVQRLRESLLPEQKFHKVVFVDMLTLFCLALLELCGHVFRTSPNDFPNAVRSFVFGGPSGLRTRESLLKELQEVVDKIATQRAMPLGEDLAQRFRLDPPYFDRLVERAFRLINKPHEAKDVLRYLQAVLLEQTLFEGTGLAQIFTGTFSEITFKFVGDLALFYLEATGVKPSLMPALVA